MQRGRRWTLPPTALWVGLGFALLFVALRLAFLRADPPIVLPSAISAHELFVEPAAKSHEARNWALFGTWQTNPSDNYQFWRAQSPVWVYPLAGFFRLFGVGYAQLRVFAVLGGLLGLLVLLALARRGLGRAGVLAVGVFTCVDYVGIHYGRVGLIEPLLSSWVTLSVLLLYLARRDARFLLAVPWALLAAFLTKQSAAYILPVALGFGGVALFRGGSPGRSGSGPARGLRGAIVLQAVVLAVGLVLYLRTDAYARTIAWNFGHAAYGEDGATAIDASGLDVAGVVGRALSLDKAWVFASTYPLVAPLALLEGGRLVGRLARRRKVSYWHRLVLGWWASIALVLLLSPLSDVRFYDMLRPSLVLLAASGVQTGARLAARRWGEGGRRLVLASVLGVFVANNGFLYLWWVSDRRYDVVAANTRVVAAIGARPAVVIGLWSAPLVLETPYLHYYVKNDFNASKEALEALGVTHLVLLERKDYTRTILGQHYPGLVEGLQPVDQFDLRYQHVGIFSLPAPLGQAPPKLRLLGPRPGP